MPVEIKELIIRAVAIQDPPGPPDAATPEIPPVDTAAIIAACVKEVLKILQQSKDR